jgi:hypothetical protein
MHVGPVRALSGERAVRAPRGETRVCRAREGPLGRTGRARSQGGLMYVGPVRALSGGRAVRGPRGEPHGSRENDLQLGGNLLEGAGMERD